MLTVNRSLLDYPKMNSLLRSAILLLALALASCQGSGEAVHLDGLKDIANLEEFTKNGVRVQFLLQEDVDEKQYITAQFSPLEPGYYLYGAELPEEGIKGLGVPTGFKVLESDGVKSKGQAFADRESQNIDVEFLGIQLPVYEVGPVTLRMPIEVEAEGARLEVQVSYMACRKEDGICLPPVRKKKQTLTI